MNWIRCGPGVSRDQSTSGLRRDVDRPGPDRASIPYRRRRSSAAEVTSLDRERCVVVFSDLIAFPTGGAAFFARSLGRSITRTIALGQAAVVEESVR